MAKPLPPTELDPLASPPPPLRSNQVLERSVSDNNKTRSAPGSARTAAARAVDGSEAVAAGAAETGLSDDDLFRTLDEKEGEREAATDDGLVDDDIDDAGPTPTLSAQEDRPGRATRTTTSSSSTEPTLLLRVAGVFASVSSIESTKGTLSATPYGLEFIPTERTWRPPSYFCIPMGTIARLDGPRSGDTSSERRTAGALASSVVTVSCRDMRVLRLGFASRSEAVKVESLLRSFAFPLMAPPSASAIADSNIEKDAIIPEGLRSLYAFDPKAIAALAATAGGSASHSLPPRLFPAERSFPASLFRRSSCNRTYALIPSYPPYIWVPKTVSDEDLAAVATFRSKGRLPALCWFDDAGIGGSIWRCAQPKVGIGMAYSIHDEAEIDAIRRTTASLKAVVFDCRPQASAVANRVRGMGHEDVSRYPGTRITFESIPNIHVVRASHIALAKLLRRRATGEESGAVAENWLVEVENTGWLNNLRAILAASVKLASLVGLDGVAAVVHCSDGWDRTSQVSALAQMLLDPRAREIRGFCATIHHEFVAFGHRFRDRIGVGVSDEVSVDERSPVFLQFLDCVAQLLRLFPTRFAFGERLLLVLAEHLYSCRFGEFLVNSAREYEVLSPNFASLWTHFASRVDDREFANQLYDPDAPAFLLPHPGVVCRSITLWDAHLAAAQFPASVTAGQGLLFGGGAVPAS